MNTFSSGRYISQGYYKSFQPDPVNKKWILQNNDILYLLSKADRQLGRLDTFSQYVNIDLFIQMHLAKEATQSSKIEGTQTNMEEAFLEKSEVTESHRNDWEEVQNYISAMQESVKMLNDLPFSSRLIRNAHEILLQGVRGANKLPGEYRKSQNWIGGATINDAAFIPPVHSSVNELMSDLETFANDESNKLPDLIKIAIIHYQFETIHPFLDGNGRVGRLLITLYLVDKGILKQPILYLSDFFERNRSLYYDNLMRTRTHNDIEQWIKFFLSGVIETAKKGVDTFDGVLKLQKRLENEVRSLGSKSVDLQKVIDSLYVNPIIDVMRIEKIIGKSHVTSYKVLNQLIALGVLTEIKVKKKIYVFQEYFELFSTEQESAF